MLRLMLSSLCSSIIALFLLEGGVFTPEIRMAWGGDAVVTILIITIFFISLFIFHKYLFKHLPTLKSTIMQPSADSKDIINAKKNDKNSKKKR